MTTKESLKRYIADKKKNGYGTPIFIIMLFQHADKETIYPSGKRSGFPSLGASAEMGFYYNIDDAIETMNMNNADIQEMVYNAGFILCHFPGLYQAAGTDERMYFVWDDNKQGFFQEEEPQIFKHIAY